MIALVDTRVSKGPELVLQRMFEARKAVFVDLLGWDVPVLEEHYEVDQFDDAHARYLVLTDADHRHLGSARLLPTTRPHILDTLFPALCAGPVPSGPEIFEVTRFCLDRRLGASRRRIVRDQLVTALTQHALANSIRTYTGVAEQGWLGQVLRFGWNATRLGQPLPDRGTTLGALRIDIDANTPMRLERSGMWRPAAPLLIDAATDFSIAGVQP
ncbi:autoinducer synthase [Sphingomonas sp. R647]|uniref:acyl-homoserine-lactone synthase n=1 Tax=Sphingomonas sp. R647 TaxID=2875233 RepID=UPI001CD80CA1|nr:acyl-homoserine-lactone synthase [Sphingomonas sp. R647]MCA1196503.1 autoinducer synthase [Sphingomonas sp. R647]